MLKFNSKIGLAATLLLSFSAVFASNSDVTISSFYNNLNYPNLAKKYSSPLSNKGVSQYLSTQDLEQSYEVFFCQLNSKHNITLNSKYCLNNINFIASQADTGYFNLNNKPIVNNNLGIEQVEFKPVTYTTNVNINNTQRSYSVSGGMFMPVVPKNKLKGLIMYFHGTTFNKDAVGSDYTKSMEVQMAASVFASQGYIVLIPDYIGQGIDWKDVHPYVLYPKANVKSSLDMLDAITPIIEQKYSLNNTDKIKLFSAGYSEGGAYALWFNTYLTSVAKLNNLYNFVHSIGMEGAYNTSVVTKKFLFDNVAKNKKNEFNIQNQLLTNMVKPMLGADALLSYAVYHNDYDYNSIFNSKFFDMNCIFKKLCTINNKHLNISEAFNEADINISNQLLVSALGKKNNGSSYPINLWDSSSNSLNSLVSSSLLTNAAQKQLDKVLKDADVNLTNIVPKSASIISLSHDSVVSPDNYIFLKNSYSNQLLNTISIDENNLKVVSSFSYDVGHCPIYENVDHLQGLTYEFLYTLNIFNSLQ